jgi:hypothetical protein
LSTDCRAAQSTPPRIVWTSVGGTCHCSARMSVVYHVGAPSRAEP